MISVRVVLIVLAVAMTLYFAVRGLWGIDEAENPWLIVAAMGLYLVATVLCLFWEGTRTRVDPLETPGDGASRLRVERLPAWTAALAILVAVIVPNAVAYAVGPYSRTDAFATWYVGGVGVVMTIVMVRRRPWVAWTGIVVLTLASMAWMGPLPALSLGVVGSVMWVVVAQLLRWSLDRAARDTVRLAQLQRAASGWQAAQLVRQRERRVRVQRALAVAGPVLTRVIATGGELSAEDRLEARLAEGELRDELRGPRLLDDDVRSELARARRRGASVTMLDEGGLEGLGEEDLAIIRTQLAETLRSATSERLYIRTSPHESIAVTVVGRSAASDEGAARGLSDEDTVDLWREIPHPRSDPSDAPR